MAGGRPSAASREETAVQREAGQGRARQGKVRKGEGNSCGGAHAISDITNCASTRVTSRFETHDLPTHRGEKFM